MTLKIKLFSDGADIGEMYEVYKKGTVQGFTTNTTLMKKAGVKNYEEFAKQALELIPNMPISFEVFSDDLDDMYKEAVKIASWGGNVYVKIPITNTQGISTVPIIENLSGRCIKLNITAILTVSQVKTALQVLSKDTPSIISIFAGRIADTGVNPVITMIESKSLINKSNKNVELLWASTRELYNIIQAQECRCDIITVTPDILKKLPMMGKNLTELSLDTVKQFKNDADESGYKIL